jgi:hypothetical protein
VGSPGFQPTSETMVMLCTNQPLPYRPSVESPDNKLRAKLAAAAQSTLAKSGRGAMSPAMMAARRASFSG